MKCSHGVEYESKCRGCFEDAMKRVSASGGTVRPAVVKPEEKIPEFYLGDIQNRVDTIPRHQ